MSYSSDPGCVLSRTPVATSPHQMGLALAIQCNWRGNTWSGTLTCPPLHCCPLAPLPRHPPVWLYSGSHAADISNYQRGWRREAGLEFRGATRVRLCAPPQGWWLALVFPLRGPSSPTMVLVPHTQFLSFEWLSGQGVGWT